MRNPLNKAVVFVMFTVLLVIVHPLVFPAGFSLGDTVEVCNTGGSGLIVRDAPAGNDVGVKYDGDRGMILAGPQTASLGEVDYTWWKVRWGEDAHQGWSAEGYPGGVDYLGKVTISPSARFSAGDFVKIHGSGAELAVRTDPPALLWQSSAAENVAGKIVGGPFYGVANGMPGFCSFWKVDYGIDLGWSAEDYLIETTVPRMSVNPSSIVNESIVPGDLITLEVNVTGIPQDPGTCAIQFRLEWDSTVLNGVTITTPTGHFMDPDGTAWAEGNLWIMARRIGIGYADYAVTFYDLSLAIAHGYAPRYGSGVLVRLTLRVMSVGSTAITLKETIIGDRDANPVFHSAENGYFRNKPGSIADSFRFPLDGPWTISRRFGNYFPEWTGYHLGEDVLRSFEAPVYAPADGVVKHNSKKSYYGYVVIIEHQLEDETYVCSVLGHLREAGRIAVGTKVTKGQRIGYLSSIPGDNGEIIHLHYGVRKGEYSEELDPDGQWRYRGYGPMDIVGSWCLPSAFIEYYSEVKETPPSYSLTINTEGGGAAASSTLVCLLTFKTTLTLIATHPWFQRWIDTDNDNLKTTTVTMFSNRVVIEWCLSAPPPTPPKPWELAIALIGADYSWGGQGWNWTLSTGRWDGPYGKWLSAEEIKAGYYHYQDPDGPTKPKPGVVIPAHGVDCAGMVTWAYNKEATDAGAVAPEALINPLNPIDSLSSGAWYLWKYASTSITKEQLQPGDLLFFDTPDLEHKDPDHVAMYVGNFDCNGKTYNVTHASGHPGVYKVTPAWYNATDGTLITEVPGEENQTLPVNRGYGRVNVALDDHGQLICRSPIDVIVTDPDGIILSKEVGEVPGMSYMEFDVDGDGDLDDIVDLWEPKIGNYLINVVPHPDALPTDNFTIEFSANDTNILLADYAQISEAPTDLYIVACNDTSIMLRNINTAITDVTISKKFVGQGYSLSINTTVQNQGNLDETFNATVYTNETTLATFTDIALTSGSSTTLALAWNTTGLAYGNYSISAYAPPVEGEIYTADNILAEDWVLVTIPGDINGDRRVNILDAIKIANSFNSKLGDANWNPNADINGDDKVNILDAIKLANHFNEYWT